MGATVALLQIDPMEETGHTAFSGGTGFSRDQELSGASRLPR
jgi:hypothetical protein